MGEKIKKPKTRKQPVAGESAGQTDKAAKRVKAADREKASAAPPAGKPAGIPDVAAQAALAIEQAKAVQAERAKVHRVERELAPDDSAQDPPKAEPERAPWTSVRSFITTRMASTGKRCHCPAMALALVVVSTLLVFQLWPDGSHQEPVVSAVGVPEKVESLSLGASSGERPALAGKTAPAPPAELQPAAPAFSSVRDLSDRVNLATEKTTEWTVAIDKQETPVGNPPPLARPGISKERAGSIPPLATRRPGYPAAPGWQPPYARQPAYRQPDARNQEEGRTPRFDPVWRM